ncbi:MAG: hypothetical protein IJ489_11740 [Clostridia bacterium]|nr:hypothetical protein [Clostridia bacterium]
MKRKIFSLTILLLASLMLFSSCSDLATENEAAREMTETFIDATLANDLETAYAVMTPGTDKESFSQVFPKIASLFQGAESYTLKQTAWHTNINNGVKTTTFTYSMETDEEKTFIVQSSLTEGYEGLYWINFNDTEWVTNKAESFSPLNIALIIYSVASIAFCVWMLVDCIRRKITKKPLWIILNLIGINLALTISPERMNFNWSIGLFLKISGVTPNIYQNLLTISVLLPVGAIIYFFIRKRIATKPMQNTVVEGEAKDITPTDETTAN